MVLLRPPHQAGPQRCATGSCLSALRSLGSRASKRKTWRQIGRRDVPLLVAGEYPHRLERINAVGRAHRTDLVGEGHLQRRQLLSMYSWLGDLDDDSKDRCADAPVQFSDPVTGLCFCSPMTIFEGWSSPRSRCLSRMNSGLTQPPKVPGADVTMAAASAGSRVAASGAGTIVERAATT